MVNRDSTLNLSQIEYKFEESCVPINTELVCIESINCSEYNNNNDSSDNNIVNGKSESTLIELHADGDTSNWPVRLSKIAAEVCQENDVNLIPAQVAVHVHINKALYDEVEGRTFSNSNNDNDNDNSAYNNNNNSSISTLANELAPTLSSNCIPFDGEVNKLAGFQGDTGFGISAIKLSNLPANDQKNNVARISMIPMLQHGTTTRDYDVIFDEVTKTERATTCLKRSSSSEDNEKYGPLHQQRQQQQNYQVLVKQTNKQCSNSHNQVHIANSNEQIKVGKEKGKSNSSLRDIRQDVMFKHPQLSTPNLASNQRCQNLIELQSGSKII